MFLLKYDGPHKKRQGHHKGLGTDLRGLCKLPSSWPPARVEGASEQRWLPRFREIRWRIPSGLILCAGAVLEQLLLGIQGLFS